MQLSDIKMELDNLILICAFLEELPPVEDYVLTYREVDIKKKELQKEYKNCIEALSDINVYSKLACKWRLNMLWILELYTRPKYYRNAVELFEPEYGGHVAESISPYMTSNDKGPYGNNKDFETTETEMFLQAKIVYEKMKAISESLSICTQAMTLPLPDRFNIQDSKDHDLVIRTYTPYEDLLLYHEDIICLHEILELISSVKDTNLIDDDKNIKSDYAVRRISTGSFELFVTTLLPYASAIAGFIFLIIKECQQAKERQLNMELKKTELEQSDMKITSQIINDASKILSVDPDNEVYRGLIHMAGLHTLNYLKRNPHGSINGREYIIREIPTPVIEEIDDIENN